MNRTLIEAKKWLDELGIKSVAQPTFLKVSRTSMLDTLRQRGADETTVHNEVINALKSVVSSKLYWGGRDDLWLYLDSF